MSYYANGGGPVLVKRMDELKTALKEAGLKGESVVEMLRREGWDADLENNSICWMYFAHDKFSDDIPYRIAPFVETGHIDMTGEDGEHWQYAFYDGRVEEYSGRVIYPGSPFADPDM